MTPDQARTVAAGSGWLSRQQAEFRDRLLGDAKLRHYPDRSTVTSLGDDPGGLTCVVGGFLDVLIAPGPFPPTLVYIARPGWWVGEAAAITGTTRRAGLIARTDTWLLQFPAEAIRRLASEYPGTWRHLAEITVSHLDNALLLAASLSSPDLRLRLAATIWRLTGPGQMSDPVTELPLTREEIGEIAGLSRNTAGRLLAGMARDGLVEARYGRLVVTDPDGLQALLTG